MTKLDDTLSAAFDLPQQELTEIIDNETGEIVNFAEKEASKIETDFDVSRNNLRGLLAQGQEALQHALEVAKQSEHPRAFEVVGNLVKQLADVNQQLMDLHQQKQKLEGGPSKKDAKNVTNNAIFVGSTSELNKMIKKLTSGES